MDSLFEDGGSKIKFYAKTIFAVLSIVFIILGILCFFIPEQWYIGLILIFLGPIASYLSALLLYSW